MIIFLFFCFQCCAWYQFYSSATKFGFLVWCNNRNMIIFIYRWCICLWEAVEENPEDIILHRVTTWEIRMFGGGNICIFPLTYTTSGCEENSSSVLAGNSLCPTSFDACYAEYWQVKIKFEIERKVTYFGLNWVNNFKEHSE